MSKLFLANLLPMYSYSAIFFSAGSLPIFHAAATAFCVSSRSVCQAFASSPVTAVIERGHDPFGA